MNYLAIPDWVWDNLHYAAPLLALFAGAFIIQGVIGARRGWHPTCRRCKHDLRAASAGVGGSFTVCPECGADLQPSRAVATGRLRVRPWLIVVGIAFGVTAGYASSALETGRLRQLRMELIASMPATDLVGEIFNGGKRGNFAFSALQPQLKNRPQSGSSIPSGVLLGAILDALKHCSENGQLPSMRNIPSQLFQALDERELTALIPLAFEELLESRGAKRDLLDVLIAATSSGAEGETKHLEQLATLLELSPQGKALLQPRPEVRDTPAQGTILDVHFAPLVRLRDANRRGDMDPTVEREFISDRCELRSAAASTEALPRALSVIQPRAIDQRHYDAPHMRVLIDAPPGEYQLKITGVLVPRVLVPRAKIGSLDEPERPSPTQAAAIEGAIAVDETISVTVRAREVATIHYTQGEAAMVAFAECLASARLKDNRGLGYTFELGSMRSRERDDVNVSYALRTTAVQGEVRGAMGSVSGEVNGDSHSLNGILPQEFDVTKPFEIELQPDPTSDAFSTRSPTDGVERLWAKFVLQFANATAKPVVTTALIPLGEAQGRAVDDDAMRSVLNAYVERLAPRALDPFRDRGRGTTPRDTVRMEPARKQYAALATPTVSGRLELFAGERLAAPSVDWFGSITHGRAPGEFKPVFDVANSEPLTLRYTPDVRIGEALAGGPFDYIGVPFELRYATGTSPPTLVFLENASPKK